MKLKENIQIEKTDGRKKEKERKKCVVHNLDLIRHFMKQQ